MAQAILGGLTVVLIYLGLEELTRRRWLAIIGALSICLSYGFWHYSSDVIYIAALYVSKRMNAVPSIRRRELLLPVSVLLLLLTFHLTLTLPYETKGGVFEVASVLKDDKTIVAFQDKTQARILPYISPNSAETLPADFCNTPSSVSSLWVVRKDAVAKCPLLASATEITRFQVDRTRVTWVLFDMTATLQIK